ncbi:WD40 repeat domain-containing serine/threonine protein kinase [Lujinxingia vulgaris]|nr:serine/threonine-protein kinase [Lujinxingia vulgaris]
MSNLGSSSGTGQHIRALREARRQKLREQSPQHHCPSCMSVVFADEPQCLECALKAPEDGWPSLEEANDPWLGRVIDKRYLVAKPLGRGSSAAVYRAESLSISRHFAIKIISTDKGQADQIIERLNREVEALSRLRNPHIVSFYEILDLKGSYVAAIMDLISGMTLEDLVIRQGPLSVQRACALLRQIANGLYEAHQAGMIHRDLKPENMMVERLPAGDDFMHILDFGIVRLTDDSGVSMTHGFIGTPLYASPEQAMAKTVDRRSDIYSLGAILFFMLTGKPPFISNNVYSVLRMHVRQKPPRLSEAHPGRVFPEELERLVARMLAKEPSERPNDLSEVIAALDTFANSQLSSEATSSSQVGSGRMTPPSGVFGATKATVASSAEAAATSDASVAAPPAEAAEPHGFGREEHTSAATLQAFGKRQPAHTPVFSRIDTPQHHEGLKAIPAQVRYAPHESSSATAVPGALHTLRVSPAEVVASAHSGGSFVILEGAPHEAMLFDAGASSPRPLAVATASRVTALALGEDAIFAGHRDGSISRTSLDKAQTRTLFQDVRRASIASIAVSPGTKSVIAGSTSGRVYAHQPGRSSSSEWTRVRNGEAVRCVALGAGGDTAAISRRDNSVEILSLGSPRQPTAQFRTEAPVTAMALSPDNYLLAAALANHTLALFQIPTGRKLMTLPTRHLDVLALLFADGSTPTAICAVDRRVETLCFEQISAGAAAR